MDENDVLLDIEQTENVPADDKKEREVTFNLEKDFYKGAKGELRLKAEGLFKKAKEKGISIEDIQVVTLKENSADIPGIGLLELSTFIAKVTGKLIKTEQMMTDGKQIDYYNRYQKYIAKKVEQKNIMKDPDGKIIWESGRPKIQSDPDLSLTEWERFEIGKALVEDKEFGLEKTITGACDRVIRKLMGENDWLYPEEAALLDEEFEEVQEKIRKQEKQEPGNMPPVRKASDKQISYFKSKIKNVGLDAEKDEVIRTIMTEMGFGNKNMEELTIKQMSKAIDSVYQFIPQVKEKLSQNLQ